MYDIPYSMFVIGIGKSLKIFTRVVCLAEGINVLNNFNVQRNDHYIVSKFQNNVVIGAKLKLNKF